MSQSNQGKKINKPITFLKLCWLYLFPPFSCRSKRRNPTNSTKRLVVWRQPNVTQQHQDTSCLELWSLFKLPLTFQGLPHCGWTRRAQGLNHFQTSAQFGICKCWRVVHKAARVHVQISNQDGSLIKVSHRLCKPLNKYTHGQIVNPQ